MTDTEIIKALECCKSPAHLGACDNCPFDNIAREYNTSCTTMMLGYTLDLINRQKAEIERLQNHNLVVAHKHYDDGIRDFAKRLKEEKYPWKQDHLYSTKLIIEDIDNLVKKMTEDSNE